MNSPDAPAFRSSSVAPAARAVSPSDRRRAPPAEPSSAAHPGRGSRTSSREYGSVSCRSSPRQTALRPQKLPRKARHVLRRTEIDISPVDARGMPAFGIAASGRSVTARMRSIAVSTVAGPASNCTQSRLRLQRQPSPLRPPDVAVQAVRVLIHRHHRQHRRFWRNPLSGVDGLLRLIDGGHCLHHQQVDPHSRPPATSPSI